MAPLDDLSPAGSSMYSSNTMYVGDGTWDASRNDFLLPNLVGLNFETMRYNGMGNRFRDFAQYHPLIKGHGIIATITFLFIVPAAILIARFYGRNPGWALHAHIYLQIMTVALSTVLFVLGFMAVGPSRSLSNPHHGIGVAIYVLILVQAIGGGWIYRREKGKARRKLPIKLVLHQWFGRAIAILGIIQVPLGLTLYGSPKWTFVLYTLWMTFLLVLYFILSYRALAPIGGVGGGLSSHGGTIITEEKKKRSWLGPLAAGAGIAALLARRRSKRKERERSTSRSRSRSRLEVIPSRRGSRRDSGSFIEEEKYESRHDEGGGLFSKAFKVAGVVGAGALVKSWYDRRQQRKEEDAYSSVAPDTPSKRHGRHRRQDSVSDDSLSVHRMEQGRPILPGPGDPVAAAAAISAAERPAVPRPAQSSARRESFDSSYYTDSLSAANSPSRRPQSTHKLRNTVLAGVGLGWAAKMWRDRSKRKEQDRLDQLEEDARIEEERRARHGRIPAKYTGDGIPAGRHGRRSSRAHSSDLSSVVVDDVHTIRPGTDIPPIPAAMAGGLAGAALASGGRSSSRHDLPPADEPLQPPPHFPQAESGSEQYASSGGAIHRRHSSRRRREGEAAAAAAVAGAASLAAEEESRRRRSRSRDYSQGPAVASPPVSVKVKMHGDRDRNVTLRRLTEQEVAAEAEARRSGRRRRADSFSDSNLSGADTAASRRKFRRERREADEIAAEKLAEAGAPPPSMAPLDPPRPAFAGGRPAKDSAYYSGRPDGSALGSPESHGTWSAMSPGSGSEAAAADRRRRRRLERQQRPSGTVDYN